MKVLVSRLHAAPVRPSIQSRCRPFTHGHKRPTLAHSITNPTWQRRDSAGAMPISYTVDYENRIVRTVWAGDVNAADVRAHWLRYRDDPVVMALRRTLSDLRTANLLLSGDELYALIRDAVLPQLDGGGWKTALLVADPAQFGASRQHQVFTDIYSHDTIFHDAERALAWLMNADLGD